MMPSDQTPPLSPDLPSAVPLRAKVDFLRRPASYPEQPAAVSALETHMSWVFLTDRHAYKLKKPIRLEDLNFLTLESRHHFCCEEVRLNRRLAPDIYRGLSALTLDESGGLRLGGSGPAVEWLVRMRRLRDDSMLDHHLHAGTVTPDDLRPVAELLARFFLAAPPLRIAPAQYKARFTRAGRANIRELSRSLNGLSRSDLTTVAAAQARFLYRDAALLEERARAGRIIEGHGDLRPEHICLGSPPAVIDCLEFNRFLRILDAVDELSFLALECERLGAPWAGDALFAVYREITGDAPPARLIAFYKAHRACIRAKLALWHLTRDGTPGDPKWIARAQDYLGRAAVYARSF